MGSTRAMESEDPQDNLAIAENLDWEAMPFVQSINGVIVSHWSPVENEDYFVSRQHGVHYAVLVIEHLRRYQGCEDVDTSPRLSDVVRGICHRGRWTGAEFAFLQSLADYIGSNRVLENAGFECLSQLGQEDLAH